MDFLLIVEPVLWSGSSYFYGWV